MNNSSVADWKLFSFQALVIITGWVVVHWLSGRRDIEKARRELVAASTDVLSEQVNIILTDAHEYHLNPRCKRLEIKLKMALQDLTMKSVKLSDICRDRPTLASCRHLIGVTRRAITARHFEDEHDGEISEGDLIVESIADSVLRLKQCLLQLKYRQFAQD